MMKWVLYIFVGFFLFSPLCSMGYGERVGAYPRDFRVELNQYCHQNGIAARGCNTQMLRPLRLRYRRFNPLPKQGECRYLVSEPGIYAKGQYRYHPRLGYLCGP